MNQSETVVREYNLDVKKLILLFQECQKDQIQLRDKDIILLAGPTGSGKSTTANYLLGQEMYTELIKISKEVYGQTYQTETEVFNSKGIFQIGHSKQSQTSTLQAAHLYGNYFLCDSPGFFDNRGTEIEIANAFSLNQFMLNCNSMKLVVLISYHELVAQRGALFQEVFNLLTRILKNPEKEQSEKIIFLFTMVPKEKKVNDIVKEILEFLENFKNENDIKSQMIISFLKAILNQLKPNNYVIVNPVDGNHKILLQQILNHQSFINPSEEFCFSVSGNANQRLLFYAKETSNIVTKFQQKGFYREIMEKMVEYKQICDYTSYEYLLNQYQDLLNEIARIFEKQKNLAFNTFYEASEKSIMFSCQNIKEILEIIQHLKIIDEFKGVVFEEGQFKTSEIQFKQDIDEVCFQMSQRIIKDFPQNIENVKNNLQKLKDFSDQTSLCQQIFDKTQKNIRYKHIMEIEDLKLLSTKFFQRTKQLEVNSIKDNLANITQKIGSIKLIEEFLRAFILKKDENFYSIVQIHLKENNELLSNLKRIINNINKEIQKQPSLDDNQIVFSPQIECMPDFEINILKIQNQNSKYSEYIPDCEILYNQALLYLKEFNQQVFSLIKENSQDSFHLYQLQNILKIIDEIRNQDDLIQGQTAEEYRQIKDEIKQKIKKKASKAKKILNKYLQDIKEEESSEEEKDDDINNSIKSNDELVKSQQIDFDKLLKTYNFLTYMLWTDDYFQTKFTQNSIQKLFEKLNKYFEICKQSIFNLIKNDKFQQVRQFLQSMSCFTVFKNRNEKYQEQYDMCIDLVKKKVQELNKQINEFISSIQRVDHIFNSDCWERLNQNILLLQNIQTLGKIADAKRDSTSSLNDIKCLILKYFEENFKQIENLTKAQSYTIVKDFTIYNNFVKQAKLISKEYLHIQSCLKGFSFEQLTTLIQKVYDEMVFDYTSKKQKMQNLEQIQESYDGIQKFIQSMNEFNFLQRHFESLPTPKETIQEKFKKLENLIKNEDFQSLDSEIFLLNQLQSDTDKQALDKAFQKIYNKLFYEIQQVKIYINFQKNEDFYQNFQKNLQNLSQILSVLEKYKIELYQNSQNELNSFRQNYVDSQKQMIFSQIKQLKFLEMQQQYRQLMQSFNYLNKFRNIFQQKDWDIFIQEINQIKEEIPKIILSLHNSDNSGEFQYLLNLLQGLNEAQTQKCLSNYSQTIQKEILNTIEMVKSVFKNYELSIREKIKNQDNFFSIELKIIKDFVQKAENIEQLKNCDFQASIFQIEQEIKNELNKSLQEIQNLLVKKQHDMAIEQLQKIKQVDEQFFHKLIKKIENVISQAVNLIKEQFPYIEISSFQNNFLAASSFLVIIKNFVNEEGQHKTLINQLSSHIFTQSRKLFEICENVLIISDHSFTQQNLYNLFKHHSFFKIIQEETVQKAELSNLQQYFKSILVKVIEGLQQLYQAQQLMKESMQVDQTLNKNLKKFNALHQILQYQPQLFDLSDELKQIKQIGLEILNHDQMLLVIKENFNCQEQAFTAALENCDFQQVKEIIFKIRKFSQINQEFNTEFIDISSMFKIIQQKVNQITREALDIVRASFTYDLKMYDLMNKIYQADEHLKIIDQYPYEPQIQIILNELTNKLDQEISQLYNRTFTNQQNLNEISQFLISIQQISEQVCKFGQIANKKLFEAAEIIKKAMGEEVIFKLGNILKQDASGAHILNNIPIFYQSFKIDTFNELVGKHDINYILEKLQYCKRGGIKQNLSDQLKEQLKQYYDIYLKKYEETIQKYKYNKNKWEKIVKKVKILSIQIKRKEDKNEVLNLLAQICAFWTLIESGEQKQGKKDIFKKPNHTQIISIIMLLGIHRVTGFWQGVRKFFSIENQMQFKNQLIEILTGEGKSITLGFCSLMLALLGCEVDVVCYSSYLSQRDNQDFRKLFSFFGVSEKIKYGTLNYQAEKYIDNYLNVRQTTLNIVNQSMQNDHKNLIKNTKNCKILLIDEVDIFFNLDYYGKTYNPLVYFETQEIKNIITEIWNQRGQSESKIIRNIEQSSNYKELINKFPKYEQLFQRHIIQLAYDVNKVNHQKQIKSYVVRDNKIGYRQNDSTIYFGANCDYQTLFAYFLENSKGNIDDQTLQKQISLNLGCGQISYALLPDSYSAILGVTGTLQSLNYQMKQSLKKYKFSKEIYIPSMFGDSKLDFRKGDMVKVETDLQNQYLQIQQISYSAITKKQSVLIFFKDSESLIQYHKSNYLYLPKENYLVFTDHDSSEDFNFQVLRVTKSGQIGLFVREYGRGTDFISLDPMVNESGGVVVIQTFLSDNKTEEIQIKGRTARQGQQGQYYLILNQQDLIKDFGLNINQIQQWKNNQNNKSLYDNLNEIRNKKENDLYQNIENDIKQATNIHQKTMEYIQNIKNKNYDQANRYINESC
ncbi:SecA DEAD-box-like domain protein (macronuclear) [Tetrahymena thermophila SB210]|uniref:SecA DEAD-box-like domain protein n=1 Tax=Tetrahymena thermophila (strain SB210) TaxID=312017 RepID=Q23BT9_TETTS|nr:SecA DEAD-box-like domain protein [Tetrahymena thermophila SB210]EAR94029.2 SecA DEAD-box-like domain protein [Tetrahymena thermophila SB210]|eukprot:XP_001014274.2 SecA DEAD-box-like domain protein [Tetrahymena thermophila SB210]